MRKYFLILWSIAIITVLIFLLRLILFSEPVYKEIPDPYTDIKLKSEIFKPKRIDSLLVENPFVIAIIGNGDCKICKIVYQSVIENYPSVGKVYFDINFHDNNRLLSQALYQKGFPMIAIFNCNKEIVGICNNYSQSRIQIDSLLRNQKEWVMDITPTKIDKERWRTILNEAFKATGHYIEGDNEKMRLHAKLSLKEGSYFYLAISQ